ncbi:ABC transporter ATP-binding protein [Haladaptatus sp.]|uniref:ABC transporter ATP-binding protein n=1 Tax=Haladaptatus sp. TaxID=1973141 RepID=UPI003C584390
MSETKHRATTATTVTDEDVLISIEKLKTYYDDGGILTSNPVKAVDGVTLEIARGETLGLVGESGCGKTTLGRTLLQLEEAAAGTIHFDGTDVTTLSGSDLKAWRRNTQMVFQDPESSLNDRMTVGQIIREPLDVHEVGTVEERRERVRDLLETVGLRPEHYYRYPHQFSGGQRQRIGIARALGLEPEFVVLDEPVSALDVSVQAKILNLLEDLQYEFGLTYLFIAHDLSVVRHICDRIAVMYLGNIMEVGETEEFFASPANPYTRALLSAIPKPDPDADRDRIVLRGTPPSPRDPPSGCPLATRCPMKIRPEPYRGLDDDLWNAISVYWNTLRERSKLDRSVLDRLRTRVGWGRDRDELSAVRAEVFNDVPVPADIKEHVETAERLFHENPNAALTYLQEEFGSVCDSTPPSNVDVAGTGRVSRCHRHRDDYPTVDEVVRNRE